LATGETVVLTQEVFGLALETDFRRPRNIFKAVGLADFADTIISGKEVQIRQFEWWGTE
jgi:hypothetical protein